MEKYYITTAISYTSGKPHIGNTYEVVLADAIARYKRSKGYDVYFQTGTDEHGLKIETKAKEAGVEPQEFVDSVANEIKISPQNVRAAAGKPYKKAVKTDSGTVQAWILSGNFDESVEAVLEKMPEGFRGLKIEIEAAPIGNADASKEDVYRAVSSQIDPSTGKEINKIKSSFIKL